MRQFIIFPEAGGSDQLLPLDGRWGRARIEEAAQEQADRLNAHIYKNRPIRKVQLCAGSVASPTVLREWEVY